MQKLTQFKSSYKRYKRDGKTWSDKSSPFASVDLDIEMLRYKSSLEFVELPKRVVKMP